jgi:hypothetical protein
LKVAAPDGVQTREFKCVSCGFSDDADLNAARNIALKRLWRDELSPALRTVRFNEVPENKSFSCFLKFRAKRRGERACGRKVGSSGRAGLDAQYEDGEVAPGGNAVEPRSGPDTHASKNSSTMLSAVSPSDEASRPLAKSEVMTPQWEVLGDQTDDRLQAGLGTLNFRGADHPFVISEQNSSLSGFSFHVRR